MITQYYKIKATQENIEHGYPGCFVLDDSDDKIVGFVDFVSDCEMAIVLFEPMDINVPGMVNISSTYDWEKRLVDILDNDIDMALQWLSH
jgi:hypothetical protein